MITVALLAFAFAGLCGVYRLLKGPSLPDRIMALDLLLTSLMGAVVIDAVRRQDTSYLVLPVVLAIIGFTATVAAARFVEDEERFGSGAVNR
ncbi:MAG: monovalent cation/H+ antiporter complex subunit F [Acidimicrobiia bacterium]|nr:monovalent cation/H+ antiporter complex subunit F [Acidimicrobiia bacterium]